MSHLNDEQEVRESWRLPRGSFCPTVVHFEELAVMLPFQPAAFSVISCGRGALAVSASMKRFSTAATAVAVR